jgi:mRNA interferase RelE/StbE
MYKLIWDQEALNDLKHLDKKQAIDLVKKIEEHLIKNPDELGKRLTGQFKGLFRYRYGDYRVIYQIFKKEVEIIIVKVGHRKNIYN